MVGQHLPFTEDGNYRTFSGAVKPEELQWHWDAEDRFVCATHDSDWFFQFDNQLPSPMLELIGFFIPAGTYHRLIKGTGDLKLYVYKHAVPRAEAA